MKVREKGAWYQSVGQLKSAGEGGQRWRLDRQGDALGRTPLANQERKRAAPDGMALVGNGSRCSATKSNNTHAHRDRRTSGPQTHLQQGGRCAKHTAITRRCLLNTSKLRGAVANRAR